MNLKDRYTEPHPGNQNIRVLRIFPVVRDAVVVLLMLLTVLICWPFYSVPTGSRGVVTQFGKIIGVENEGLAVLWPWQKLSNFSIRAEQADIKDAEGSTSDTQPVHVSLTIRYSISVDKVAEVFEKYSHSGDLASYVQTASQEIFKAVTARYTAVDLIAKRPLVSHDIGIALREKLSVYGAQVISIDMTNFSFAKSYMDAINDKTTQEQKKLAADNAALTAASVQKIKVITAEADAAAIKAKADGDAYALLTNAKADAESTRIKGDAHASAMKAQALALTANPALVEMKKAEAWDGKLPVNMFAGAPIPFMNVGK